MKQICCLLMICLLCLPLCAQGVEVVHSNWTDLGYRNALEVTFQRLSFPDGAEEGDLSFLQDYLNLEWLEIDNGFPVKDLSPLAALTKLSTLIIEGGSFTDLTPLMGLKDLDYLYIAHVPVEDASPLASLTNLTSLHIWDAPITDFSFLYSLTNMVELRLSDVGLKDIDFAPHMPALYAISCTGALVSDITPLLQCPEICFVNFRNCQITDVSAFCQARPMLMECFLGDNPIADVSPLLGFGGWVAMEVTLPNGSLAYYWDHIRTYLNASPQEQATMFFEDPYLYHAAD